MLQPRRVAARATARRIADERGWTIGNEVGWHVRFERRFGPRTRVLLATEGILTARLQQDPLLSEFRTIVLDEFHERSLHADLGLALARQAWRARDDLRIVVMSATLDTARVSAFLDDCAVISVPGRLHPIEVDYQADQPLAEAVGDVLPVTRGTILCFLAGAPEIRRAEPDVRAAARGIADVVPLHGSLDPAEQDRAIEPATGRRVILATNIAETSLTVPGVTAVIDTGLHKVARYHPERAVDSLDLERIPADSAEQRAGRAGRLAPGRVRRLWSATDRLRPHREADIHRVDLSEAVLEIVAWSGDPRTFEWFDPPPPERVTAALALLEWLGAVDSGRLTDIGREMQRLPIHPRLARMLIDGGGDPDVALAAAALSERHLPAARAATTTSDLLSAIDEPARLPPHVLDVARRLAAQLRPGAPRPAPRDRERRFRHAVFAAYPDRVARRRAGAAPPRFLLASGHGAVLGRDSGVHDAEFIVAVDVTAGGKGEGSEAIVRSASAVDPEWLAPTSMRLVHQLDPRGRVRAVAQDYYGEILLRERPADVDVADGSRLLVASFLEKPLSDEDEQFVRRLRFAELPADVPSLAAGAAAGRSSLQDMSLADALDWRTRQDLDRLAPLAVAIPSGRTARLRYEADGAVTAAVKLQELFGLAESPRIGPRQQPIVLVLLAPNGRPVQTTTDLRSFWNSTYAEVRRELRGRYPKHPWPDDPWSAAATARTKRPGRNR